MFGRRGLFERKLSVPSIFLRNTDPHPGFERQSDSKRVQIVTKSLPKKSWTCRRRQTEQTERERARVCAIEREIERVCECDREKENTRERVIVR